MAKKKRLSRKESLEAQMRLTGSLLHQTANRHRQPHQSDVIASHTVQHEMQDTAKDKHISSTPLRFRAVKEALDGADETHKLEFVDT